MLQDGIKIAGRNINNLRYADNTSMMAESKEELKSLLMRVKEKSEKASLKLYIKKILRSWHLVPSTAWQTEGEKMKAVTDFTFLGSKKSLQIVIAAIILKDDCSWEGKL